MIRIARRWVLTAKSIENRMAAADRLSAIPSCSRSATCRPPTRAWPTPSWSRATAGTDPWDPGLAERAQRDEKVLLLGTGLTMVDVALTLSEHDAPGSILTVSRQGLLPQKHRRNLAPPNRWFELPPSEVNLSELISDRI